MSKLMAVHWFRKCLFKVLDGCNRGVKRGTIKTLVGSGQCSEPTANTEQHLSIITLLLPLQ